MVVCFGVYCNPILATVVHGIFFNFGIYVKTQNHKYEFATLYTHWKPSIRAQNNNLTISVSNFEYMLDSKP